MRFTTASELAPCDVLFLALPHGEAQRRIAHLAALAERIVDLSADFRIRELEVYRRYYGESHAAPEWLDRFVYGLPEINREAISQAHYVSGVGCNATAAILALLPLVRAGLLRTDRPIVVDVKAGSSEGGATASAASHHPERSGAVRSFAPTGHRHEAEVAQALGRADVFLSVTSIELVRGVLATAHAWAQPGLTDKDLWRAYRAVYGTSRSCGSSTSAAASTATPSRSCWPAPTWRMSVGIWTRRRAGWWRWRPSTTWAKARPAPRSSA